ncbi:pirin family protein [Nitrogeniibacter aestuarii]|uniref:pirin family protein n=1 Tax=Nitrogeniibacter aestuarii TaxID=2815343 RepID=UPI001E4F74A9|nr:pirin family protein [Nitrogeniibacter aestuarii]
MSQFDSDVRNECGYSDGGASIELVIEPREKDLGGFSVRRVLPSARRQMVGPWIFFDHMGPADFPAGEGISVRPHPHINLATVTYLFEGEIFHRDSLGSEQAIRPGDINLMVAGRGITHSERERPVVRGVPHTLNGLQLWLALPEADEECPPEFIHYPSESIPRVDVDGVAVRVMMGHAYGEASPVKTFADTIYIEAALDAGQTLELPDAEARGLYVADGRVTVDGRSLDTYAMAILKPGATVEVTATVATRLAMIGGETLGERFIEWNFVSSDRERIRQAKLDWANQRFPKVVGDEQEFIPLPEK